MSASHRTRQTLGESSSGQPKPRRILGELDPNKDLNTPRGLTKRGPIILNGENVEAALLGMARGTYSWREVLAYTNHNVVFPTAPAGDVANETDDDEVPGFSPAHNAQGGGQDDDADDSDDEYGAGPGGGHGLPGDDMDEEMDDDDMAGDGYGGHDMDPTGSEDGYDGQQDGSQFGAHAGSDDPFAAPAFDPIAVGLKDLTNLASFGVSSHKPGNGVEELLSDDLDKYWQSDGQQPHLLSVHFLRRVEIRAVRFYVDFDQDESYTPTHMTFFAGNSSYDLHPFADLVLEKPVGWQDVGIAGCGGGPDGHSISCQLVQIQIKENHQNGKDTHIRGIKFYSLDEAAVAVGVVANNALRNLDNGHDDAPSRDNAMRHPIDPAEVEPEALQELMDSMDYGHSRFIGGDDDMFPSTDFMRMPEIR